MADDAPNSDPSKLTLGQAIDQVIAALGAFKASDQQTILKAVYAHLNISGPEEAPAGRTHEEQAREDPAPALPPRAGEDEYGGMDVRTFKQRKNPSSARQMACVVAYYLAEIATGDERKEVITTQDVEKYFKQAGFALPKKLEQLLIDCRAAGYFESRARGEYKLTRVGITWSRTSFRPRARDDERSHRGAAQRNRPAQAVAQERPRQADSG